MISLTSISAFLLSLVFKYRYLLLYPVAIVEGPLVTLASGFLVSAGVMDPFIALPIIAAGDVSGDILYYLVGWFGERRTLTRAIINFCRFGSVKEKVEKLYGRHGGKFLLFGKLTHALGAVFLIGAGYSRMDFLRFVWYNLLGTLIKSGILMYVGFLAGAAYGDYAKKFEYGALYVTAASLILIVLSLLVSRFLFYRIAGIKERKD